MARSDVLLDRPGRTRGRTRAVLALSLAPCDEIATPSDETAGALGPVCEGDLVLDAPFYDPTEPGPHPLVLLDERGGPHAWTDSMPADWAPIDPSQAELVACIGDQQLVALQPCTADGVSVERSRALLPVDVRQAATGLLEQSFTLEGEPPACDSLAAGGPRASRAQSIPPSSSGPWRPSSTPARPSARARQRRPCPRRCRRRGGWSCRWR